jgi:hypothetical protein
MANPPVDPTGGAAPGMSGPYVGGFAITPDNNNSLDKVTRAIWVGSGGDLSVMMRTGEQLLLKSVPPGTEIRLRVTHVLAAATTASALVGLY